MSMAFAAASSFTAKRSCISGSPPLSVKPPPITFRPRRYFPSSAAAWAMVTGIPLVMVQVSGLWQYWHRHMQPVVHATTRTPGPSTADPVVNEWRNPMSPLASAVLTSVSAMPAPRLTRSSYGLLASSATAAGAGPSGMAHRSMEGPVDHVHLLLARQPHEVHRVARDANRQARVLLRVVHRVEQHVAVQHVHVHV